MVTHTCVINFLQIFFNWLKSKVHSIFISHGLNEFLSPLILHPLVPFSSRLPSITWWKKKKKRIRFPNFRLNSFLFIFRPTISLFRDSFPRPCTQRNAFTYSTFNYSSFLFKVLVVTRLTLPASLSLSFSLCPLRSVQSKRYSAHAEVI